MSDEILSVLGDEEIERCRASALAALRQKPSRAGTILGIAAGYLTMRPEAAPDEVRIFVAESCDRLLGRRKE